VSPIAHLRRRANESAAVRNLLLLAAISVIWGSSFMFIKVAVRDMAPATLVLGRVGLAAIALVVFVAVTLGGRVSVAEFRAHWPWLVVIGLINTAIPFWLLSWGETRLDSGLASIIQASVPIFVALLAFAIFHEQRITGARLVGVAVGFVGVALLVGAQPEGKIIGALAVVGMAACYALGGLLTRRHLTGVRPPVVAAGSTLIAAIALVPAGVVQAPSELPGWKAIGSVVFLGLVGTALAYLIFFTLIASAGAHYAALVTYLVPPLALAYGAIFLGERFGASAFGGLALILGGVALGTGALRPSRIRQRVGARRAPEVESEQV